MNKKSIFKGLQSFLMLWSSQTVSSLGTAMTEFALIIWVYGQKGNASSVTLLTICTFLPTILFRFIAGTIVDQWDKKRIMLVSDFVAACGTLTIFILYAGSGLQPWHLYVINILLSFMNAFQCPASYVATSLLVPKEQYTRVSGLQSFSGSVVSIFAPALGSVLLTFGGLKIVLIFDLVSFAIAFFTLLFFVKIPVIERKSVEIKESFVKNCMTGIRFLREHVSRKKHFSARKRASASECAAACCKKVDPNGAAIWIEALSASRGRCPCRCSRPAPRQQGWRSR